jgi:hypothetical protein
MSFIFKDLTISVFGEREAGCPGHGGGPTGCCASHPGTYCEAGTAGSLHIVEPEMVFEVGELVFLRQQLTEALAGVDARERELREQATPKSVAEIDSLEGKLGEALTELGRLRGELGGPSGARK